MERDGEKRQRENQKKYHGITKLDLKQCWLRKVLNCVKWRSQDRATTPSGWKQSQEKDEKDL